MKKLFSNYNDFKGCLINVNNKTCYYTNTEIPENLKYKVDKCYNLYKDLNKNELIIPIIYTLENDNSYNYIKIYTMYQDLVKDNSGSWSYKVNDTNYIIYQVS